MDWARSWIQLYLKCSAKVPVRNWVLSNSRPDSLVSNISKRMPFLPKLFWQFCQSKSTTLLKYLRYDCKIGILNMLYSFTFSESVKVVGPRINGCCKLEIAYTEIVLTFNLMLGNFDIWFTDDKSKRIPFSPSGWSFGECLLNGKYAIAPKINIDFKELGAWTYPSYCDQFE